MIAEQTRPASEEPDPVTAPTPIVGPEAPTARLPLVRLTPQQPAEPSEPSEPSPGRVLLDQMGGVGGIVYTNVPAIVFSIANSFLPLLTTTLVALGSAVVLAVFRMVVRKEKVVAASGGIIGVAFAGAITLWTGSPRDFFLIGIWMGFAMAVGLTVSLIARRPVTGLMWSWFHGRRHDWRADRRVLRTHDVATLFAAVVATARFAVNQIAYQAGDTGILAIAKVATGMPLTALVVLVAVWAFRRSTKLLIKDPRASAAA